MLRRMNTSAAEPLNMQPHESEGWLRLAMAWAGLWAANVTLSHLVSLAVLVLTCMQVWITWKKIRRASNPVGTSRQLDTTDRAGL